MSKGDSYPAPFRNQKTDSLLWDCSNKKHAHMPLRQLRKLVPTQRIVESRIHFLQPLVQEIYQPSRQAIEPEEIAGTPESVGCGNFFAHRHLIFRKLSELRTQFFQAVFLRFGDCSFFRQCFG